MFDLLITSGRILDGTGTPAFAADIGITGDTITDLGDLSRAESRATFDLSPARTHTPAHPHALLTTPGFIDAHSHSDAFLFVEPTAPSKITQGITTEICGNCGASAAPITDIDQLPSDWADKIFPGTWSSMAGYRALLAEVRTAVNVVTMVGHNTLRRNVIGRRNRTATDDEQQRMVRLLEESVEAGARGFTTGLIYAPGMYAATEELAALAGVVGRRGGVYGSHMRNEGAHLLEAIAETIDIGLHAGARVEVSHLKTAGKNNWGKIDEALALIRGARDRGEPVAADRYPYTSGSTDLDVVLPAWAHEGGRDAVFERLADPAERDRMRQELLDGRDRDDWAGVVIGSTKHPDNTRFRGMDLLQVTDALGLDHPAETVLHFAETDRLGTTAFFAGMSEENMRRILAEPYVMLGSDASLRAPTGPLGEDYPHPRAYGSFTRFLRMAFDGDTVTPAEAVRKMTSLPAEQFGLSDRGRVAKGAKADLVIFDPETVRDEATYADPHRFSSGIRAVIVNGVLTFSDGNFTGDRAGRCL